MGRREQGQDSTVLLAFLFPGLNLDEYLSRDLGQGMSMRKALKAKGNPQGYVEELMQVPVNFPDRVKSTSSTRA